MLKLMPGVTAPDLKNITVGVYNGSTASSSHVSMPRLSVLMEFVSRGARIKYHYGRGVGLADNRILLTLMVNRGDFSARGDYGAPQLSDYHPCKPAISPAVHANWTRYQNYLGYNFTTTTYGHNTVLLHSATVTVLGLELDLEIIPTLLTAVRNPHGSSSAMAFSGPNTPATSSGITIPGSATTSPQIFMPVTTPAQPQVTPAAPPPSIAPSIAPSGQSPTPFAISRQWPAQHQLDIIELCDNSGTPWVRI